MGKRDGGGRSPLLEHFALVQVITYLIEDVCKIHVPIKCTARASWDESGKVWKFGNKTECSLFQLDTT